MHSYYKNNSEKLKKTMDGFLKNISTELEADTDKAYSELLTEVWNCYEENFMENFPFIGGDKSRGTGNLTGAFMFVAMGEVCRQKYGMSLERWGYLTTLCYKRYFSKIPKALFRLVGKLMKNTKLIRKMLLKMDAKNAANAKIYPGGFITGVKPPTEEYPAAYYTYHCPLAEFADKYGYMEYMPYICNLDYVMFETIEVPFYRENTCAAGDGMCDFKLKAGAPVNSSWPCHSLTPGDTLK